MLAKKCKNLIALVANNRFLKPWLLVSTTLDPMTRDRSLFHEYNPCNNTQTVRIAYGSLFKVEGVHYVKLNEDLILNSVLHILKLDWNLLWIRQFTTNHNSLAKVFSKLCKFQEQESMKKIDSADLCSGLYLFERKTSPTRQVASFCTSRSILNSSLVRIVKLCCGTIV